MGGLTAFPISNGYAPLEGPKGMPLNVDFTSIASQAFDTTQEFQNGEIAMIQSVWVDNRDVNQAVTLTIAGTGQRIVVPANTQNVYPVYTAMPLRFTAAVPALEAHTCKLIFCNVPQGGGSWGP